MKNKPLAFIALSVAFIGSNAFSQTTLSSGRIVLDKEQDAKFTKCLDMIKSSPQNAYNEALLWRLHNGGLRAEHCLALALIGLEDYENGANQLMSIAKATDKVDIGAKTKIYTQAGNAFLLAQMAFEAQNAFDSALISSPNDANLLIDRARSFAMQSLWKQAEADLTKAMQIKGEIGFALRLRAEARLQQKNYDGADFDIGRALVLEPKEVDNYVVRGRARVARGLGHAPD